MNINNYEMKTSVGHVWTEKLVLRTRQHVPRYKTSERDLNHEWSSVCYEGSR